MRSMLTAAAAREGQYCCVVARSRAAVCHSSIVRYCGGCCWAVAPKPAVISQDEVMGLLKAVLLKSWQICKVLEEVQELQLRDDFCMPH